MKSRHFNSATLMVFLSLTACNLSVNKSIHVEDGKTVRSSLNTVNGSIVIGSECKVKGSSRSVNGGIDVGSNSQVRDLETVNGKIRVAANVKVDGGLKSINGGVSCDKGVEIDGGVTTINGAINLENTMVENDISTFNGHIALLDRSVVRGDIIVKENKGHSEEMRRLKIKISSGSIVEGDIIVKDDDIEVKVYLSEGGKVNGRIKNAELIEE